MDKWFFFILSGKGNDGARGQWLRLPLNKEQMGVIKTPEKGRKGKSPYTQSSEPGSVLTSAKGACVVWRGEVSDGMKVTGGLLWWGRCFCSWENWGNTSSALGVSLQLVRRQTFRKLNPAPPGGGGSSREWSLSGGVAEGSVFLSKRYLNVLTPVTLSCKITMLRVGTRP